MEIRTLKKNKNIILLMLIIVALALFSFGVGFYFNNLSKTKNIASVGIYALKEKFDTYFYNDFVKNYIVNGDNFSIKSDISISLSSEYYQKRINEEENYKKNNFINNLDKMHTNIEFKHDKKNSKLYFNINQKIAEEPILDYKYYISNSTKYYYANNIADSYINAGNGNYFENLSDENTLKSNIDYIYNFIWNSFINNLNDSYFEKSRVSQKINGDSKETYMLSIKIDDRILKRIYNGIIKDLKKDNKANMILSNTYENFPNYKIDDDVTLLEKNEYYTINIYTSTVLYKPLKYEFFYINNGEKKAYIYEGEKNKGTLYYAENDMIINRYEYQDDGKNIIFNIYTANDKKCGELKLEHQDKITSINYVYDDGKKKADFIYSSKIEKINNSKSKNIQKASFKKIEDMESKINGSITINSVINNKVKIDEDVENAILKAKLTEEQKYKTDNLKEIIRERLER